MKSYVCIQIKNPNNNPGEERKERTSLFKLTMKGS